MRDQRRVSFKNKFLRVTEQDDGLTWRIELEGEVGAGVFNFGSLEWTERPPWVAVLAPTKADQIELQETLLFRMWDGP